MADRTRAQETKLHFIGLIGSGGVVWNCHKRRRQCCRRFAAHKHASLLTILAFMCKRVILRRTVSFICRLHRDRFI